MVRVAKNALKLGEVDSKQDTTFFQGEMRNLTGSTVEPFKAQVSTLNPSGRSIKSPRRIATSKLQTTGFFGFRGPVFRFPRFFSHTGPLTAFELRSMMRGRSAMGSQKFSPIPIEGPLDKNAFSLDFFIGICRV